MNTPLLHLPSQDTGAPGVFAQVSAETAGWDFLNMEARRLHTGMTWAGNTGEYEWVFVILGGVGAAATSRGDWAHIGRRATPFEGMPYALYLPRQTDFTLTALGDHFEVAACWVATDEDHPAQLVTPDDCKIELRGGGNASRQINSIIPPGFDCHRLIAIEVYTPGGNWSSYPPHKHDVHRVGDDGTLLEADLEEIYFYKIDPPSGFAYQRVYNDAHTLDAVVMAQHHDAVLIPEGYHPVVSAHGYTTYYLNFLAGSAQSLANQDDPVHQWVKMEWESVGLDSRLPIVTHTMEASPSDPI